MTDHPTLSTATTAAEIIEANARREWFLAQDGTQCPPDSIPTEAELCAWLRECPANAHDNASRWLLALRREARRAFMPPAERLREPPERLPWWWPDQWERGAIEWLPCLPVGLRNMLRLPSMPDLVAFVYGAGAFVYATVEEVHATWRELGSQPDSHPLAPIVAAWQARPEEIEPERRSTGIMPESLRVSRIAAFVAAEDPQIPLTLSGGEVGEVATAPLQRPLFEFEAPPTALVPVLPLRFYRNAGGLDRTRGRGAPLAKRLWWAAIANTPIAAREPDGSVTALHHAAPPERLAVSGQAVALETA